jgi:hypothetical protein
MTTMNRQANTVHIRYIPIEQFRQAGARKVLKKVALLRFFTQNKAFSSNFSPLLSALRALFEPTCSFDVKVRRPRPGRPNIGI